MFRIHEFEQTLGYSGGQGSLECCSPWGHRVRHILVTNSSSVLNPPKLAPNILPTLSGLKHLLLHWLLLKTCADARIFP